MSRVLPTRLPPVVRSPSRSQPSRSQGGDVMMFLVRTFVKAGAHPKRPTLDDPWPRRDRSTARDQATPGDGVVQRLPPGPPPATGSRIERRSGPGRSMDGRCSAPCAPNEPCGAQLGANRQAPSGALPGQTRRDTRTHAAPSHVEAGIGQDGREGSGAVVLSTGRSWRTSFVVYADPCPDTGR